MSITSKQYDHLVEVLEEVRDRTIRIETNTSSYDAQICARRGERIKWLIRGMAVLFVAVGGLYAYLGLVPDTSKPKPLAVDKSGSELVNQP